MSPQPELRTPRFLMRGLRDDDFDIFATMHADSRVMAALSAPLSRDQSWDAFARIRAATVRHGFGLWAVELPTPAQFIGLVGLSVPSFEAAFTPCVEIAWRLLPEHWSKGYATEAARAALKFGFETLRLKEILAWTTPENVASRRVMVKLGMTHDPADDFDHPRLPEGHPLRRHVLYRVQPASVLACDPNSSSERPQSSMGFPVDASEIDLRT
jgi:RimJ/RimL family protein N-acetyltransferase